MLHHDAPVTLKTRTDELSNFGMQIDPRIGFLIKGPDTWGAKTSAYIEWDFSGINRRG